MGVRGADTLSGQKLVDDFIISWSSVSVVPHPQIQPAEDCVDLYYGSIGKKSIYRGTHAVQTRFVQGSIVF